MRLLVACSGRFYCVQSWSHEMLGSPRPRVLIFSASVGGGHDAAADALLEGLREKGLDGLRIDYLDLLPFGLGRLLRAGYAAQLRHAPASWELLCTAMHRFLPLTWLLIALTRLTARPLHRLLREEPEVVVVTYPMAGHAIGRFRRSGQLRSPLVAYLTDLAVHRLWLARGVDTYLAAHAATAEAVRALGARDVRVVAPAVRASFRDTALTRQQARETLNLPDDRRLALVTGGAWAVGEVAATVADLQRSHLVEPVVLCAGNAELRRRLDDGRTRPLAWVADMPVLMRACDVLVSNAGTTTALEALTVRLPVLLYRCLPGHGRSNAAAFQDAGLARWARAPAELPAALAATLGSRVALEPAVAPEMVLAELAGCRPVPAAHGVPRWRWAMATAAAVVIGAWASTAGTEAAVAGGLREARPARDGITLVVAPDSGPVSGRLLRSIRDAGAVLAVDTSLVRRWPGSVAAADRYGITLANAGKGRPYRTGVVSGRTAVAYAASAIRSVTGRAPALLLSSEEVDAVDVGIATWEHERILVPGNIARPARSVPLHPGRILLVACAAHTSCDLAGRLRREVAAAHSAGLPIVDPLRRAGHDRD